MMKYAIKELAVNTLINVFKPYIDDTKDALVNTARDTLESVITGRRSIDEWAEIAIKGVDKLKEYIAKQYNWKYIGGKLNFEISASNLDKVIVSFELYYQDDYNKWQKVGAESDMYASNFTKDAINDMEVSGRVSYEVE